MKEIKICTCSFPDWQESVEGSSASYAIENSLAFENAVNTSSALLVQESEMLSHMNVEDLPNDGVRIRLETWLREFPEIPKQKHWWRTLLPNNGEAINALLMHQEIKPEPYKEISKLVLLEFDDMDAYWRRVIRTSSLVSRTK